MENNNINIEEIMAQIKREIKEKGLTPDMLSFEDVPYQKPAQVSTGGDDGAAAHSLDYLNTHYYIQPYKELKGNPVKVFFKKVIRKLVKFYVEPVVFEQDNFNINTVTVLNTLMQKQGGAAPDNSELTGRIEALELAQKELLIRLDRLSRENAELRSQLGKQDEQ